jgi:hypothetical protein
MPDHFSLPLFDALSPSGRVPCLRQISGISDGLLFRFSKEARRRERA